MAMCPPCNLEWPCARHAIPMRATTYLGDMDCATHARTCHIILYTGYLINPKKVLNLYKEC